MDLSILCKSDLFHGVSADDLRGLLEEFPHQIKSYEKGETIFHLMENASRVAVVLDGKVEAQKPFPNGKQVNVSVWVPGETIGPAPVFAKAHRFPCDIVASTPATVVMFRREDLVRMMQKNLCVLENLTTEIATSTYMLQQRLELLSYSGIAQKAGFWLLMQARQTGKDTIKIPGSVSKWAMMLNVSRPSLHRELKKLEERGIIAYDPSAIKILDQDALFEVLDQ